MTTSESIREADRIGYAEYCNVNYEELAKTIRNRLNRETIGNEASIGLMPDDTWTVWYRSKRK